MAELKTKQNNRSVKRFLSRVENERRRADALELLALMEDITDQPAFMWGDSMVGFGRYHYRYASGHEGDWFVTGFSPRKQNLAIYIMPGFSHFESLMSRLGKYKTGKSCLYINNLDDIDRAVLRKLISESVKHMHEIYKCKG